LAGILKSADAENEKDAGQHGPTGQSGPNTFGFALLGRQQIFICCPETIGKPELGRPPATPEIESR
jgi:hypothetical protein